LKIFHAKNKTLRLNFFADLRERKLTHNPQLKHENKPTIPQIKKYHKSRVRQSHGGEIKAEAREGEGTEFLTKGPLS
jgi:hypothetical protein